MSTGLVRVPPKIAQLVSRSTVHHRSYSQQVAYNIRINFKKEIILAVLVILTRGLERTLITQPAVRRIRAIETQAKGPVIYRRRS